MTKPTRQLITDEADISRCWWCGTDPLYVNYHDREWGRPIADDRRLFEKICLEGFQAGLSWLTVLRKRENFRRAYRDFDFQEVARFNQRHVRRLLGDAGIIRHRGKIESVVNNARRACDMADEFGGLAGFLWRFEPGCLTPFDVQRSTCAESVALSKELKQRGWSFVGPTTMYAFMQAVGMVNDHVPGCRFHAEVELAGKRFRRPIAK